jgi:hypothetical protein
MARETIYRGKRECIFGDGGETPGGFCDWNTSVMRQQSDKVDFFDRIELCRLCTSQSLLRSVSFIGSLMKTQEGR